MTTRFELVDEGFADPCLTTWPRHHIGAADEARTRYLHLGKVALYQMSYIPSRLCFLIKLVPYYMLFFLGSVSWVPSPIFFPLVVMVVMFK